MNSSLLVLALTLLTFQHVPTTAPGDNNTAASKFAVEAAIIAGGARNCKFDDEMVEEYISLSHARISQLAKDKEEIVLAKMDFTNSLIVAAIKAPEEGCKDFNHTFRTAMHDLS